MLEFEKLLLTRTKQNKLLKISNILNINLKNFVITKLKEAITCRFIAYYHLLKWAREIPELDQVLMRLINAPTNVNQTLPCLWLEAEYLLHSCYYLGGSTRWT